MKKVAVITTGGTIGSILSADSVSVERTERRIAREIDVAKDKLGCSVVVDSPLNKHSEDLNPQDWGVILLAITRACASDADGIVVTHGTDTLVYTVAAALAFGNLWNKKICFTGSYYSPDHPESDTSLSLLAALEFSLSPHPSNGVYVAFRSNASNSEACILNAASIKPMVFDDLYFRAAYAHTVARFSPKTGITENISLTSFRMPCLEQNEVPCSQDIDSARARVGYIHLYPGIDQSMLEAASVGRDVLVVEMYHSGTGPAGEPSELLDFLNKVSPGTAVLMGTFPREYIDLPYDSTVSLQQAGARVYGDLQTHFLYVFTVLGIAAGMPVTGIIGKLAEFEI